MKQNNLIQVLLLSSVIVLTVALARPAYVPTTGAYNITETYITVKTYVDNSTVTWYEISYITPTTGAYNITETYTTTKTFTNESTTITWTETYTTTKTYTNTSTVVETFTSYRIVLKPTTVIQVESREVADPQGRVSTIQIYVTKMVMVPITETYEVFETNIIEIVEDTIITSSKVFMKIEYLKFFLVETFIPTFKPEIIESENNYLVLLVIALAVGLVAVIALARSRGKLRL